MDDEYTTMTREQLIAALRGSSKASPSKPKAPPREFLKCEFVPVRASQQPCTEGPPFNEVGFCKKHAKTLQSKRALEKLVPKDEPLAIEEEPPVVEEVRKPSTRLLPKAEPKATPKRPPTPESDEAEESEEEKTPPPPKKKTSLKPKVQKVTVFRNAWNRIEEPKTHMVFDIRTNMVYGVQLKNGSIRPLGPADVEICDRNEWGYILGAGEDDESSEGGESGSEEESEEEIPGTGEGESEEEEGSEEESEEEIASD